MRGSPGSSKQSSFSASPQYSAFCLLTDSTSLAQSSSSQSELAPPSFPVWQRRSCLRRSSSRSSCPSYCNGQSVTTSSVTSQFVLSIGAGAGAGLLWDMIFTRLMPRIIRIDNDPLLAVLCTIISPFVAFFVAEELHGSGVLAVVTAGVVSFWRGAGPQLSGLTQILWV